MPIAGMITAARNEAFKNLQLNAGAFLINFDYSLYNTAQEMRTALATALRDSTKLLGATRGGGTFVVNSTIRDPEVDGKRYRFKGGAYVDEVDAQLTGTLVEITPHNFTRILGTGEATTAGKKTTIKMHTAIQDADYIENLVWIGDKSDGGLVLIALKNALNGNGMTLTFTDKGEGTMPFEFHAYQDSAEDYDYAPFEVVFLDALEDPEVSIDKDTAEVTVGSTVTLVASTIPAAQTVTWASDDTDKATVAGGVVTGVAAGTVTITASITVDGVTKTDTTVVTVKPAA